MTGMTAQLLTLTQPSNYFDLFSSLIFLLIFGICVVDHLFRYCQVLVHIVWCHLLLLGHFARMRRCWLCFRPSVVRLYFVF